MCETWALFPLILLDSSFSGLRYFLHMHALMHTLECSWVTLHISLRFFSVQLSHFQYSALPIIPSLESPLYLFHSGRPLDSFGVTSFLCHHLETFSIQEAIAMIGLTYFSHFSQKRLSFVHCLKNHYFMYFVFFGGEGVSGKG